MNTVRCHLAPGCALQVPVMRIGVPGEFHEDRWPRTAEDSERRVIPRTRETSMPSDTTFRVARGSSGLSSTRRPCPQVLQWHSGVSKRVFWPVFGTATLPTSTSVASPRAEEGLVAGLRHGHPAHRYLSGIPAWRRGLLTGLRHGHQAYKYLSGILVWRRWSSISARP